NCQRLPKLKTKAPWKHRGTKDTEDFSPSLIIVQCHLCSSLTRFHFRGLWQFWHFWQLCYPCSSVVRFLLLCLAASYNNMDAAIPALSDSTRGECGIVTSSSAMDKISAGTPAPSFPTTIMAAPAKLASGRGLPLCDDVANTR